METTKEKKKVLTGWSIPNIVVLLAGNNQAAITAEHTYQIQAAVASVQARAPYVNPIDVIMDSVVELTEYYEQFWLQPELEQFKQEGWTTKLADLRKVCTVQAIVECENSKQRTANIDPNDFLAIANISLPKVNTNNSLVTFDSIKNAWVFSSPNPNLRIIGNFSANGNLFGFAAGISNSFIQIAKCQGRYFLRDGTHRAFGFLSNSINIVPVLYKEYNSIFEMGLPQGLFPSETLLGDRPPMLTDYFEPIVSGEAYFPVSTKVLIIQGLELSSHT